MNTSYKITGSDAIRLAERDNLTIHCYANPIIDDGGVVPVGVARQIAKDDPNLIYVTVQPYGWVDAEGRSLSTMDGYNVSDYFTSDGMYLGPDDDNIEPRWNDAVISE
jgi:hypothetical protein